MSVLIVFRKSIHFSRKVVKAWFNQFPCLGFCLSWLFRDSEFDQTLSRPICRTNQFPLLYDDDVDDDDDDDNDDDEDDDGKGDGEVNKSGGSGWENFFFSFVQIRFQTSFVGLLAGFPEANESGLESLQLVHKCGRSYTRVHAHTRVRMHVQVPSSKLPLMRMRNHYLEIALTTCGAYYTTQGNAPLSTQYFDIISPSASAIDISLQYSSVPCVASEISNPSLMPCSAKSCLHGKLWARSRSHPTTIFIVRTKTV